MLFQKFTRNGTRAWNRDAVVERGSGSQESRLGSSRSECACVRERHTRTCTHSGEHCHPQPPLHPPPRD